MKKRFLLKALLLVAPFAIWLALPAVVLFIGGEFTGIESSVKAQCREGGDFLYGPAYTDETAAFKLCSTLEIRPKVLVLGSSRVMKFTSHPFKDSRAFYNAGGAAGYPLQSAHCMAFLRKLPEDCQPEVIIVGLDQYEFNDIKKQSKSAASQGEYGECAKQDPIRIMQEGWLGVYGRLFSGQINIAELCSRRGVGLNALAHGHGFRPDGSRAYGRFDAKGCMDPESSDYLFRDTLNRIANGSRPFHYGKALSAPKLAALEAFLDECRSRNIHVVAFLPPFAHRVYTEMTDARGGEYAYLPKVAPAVRPLLESRGFAFFDFSDLEWVGVGDDEAIDGFHGSERAYLQLLLKMAERDEILARHLRSRDELQGGRGRILESSAGVMSISP